MSGGGDSSLLSVIVAVSMNSVVTLAKYLGYFVTGSPALLAEAVHSTADVGNQVLLWIGIRASQREADPELHPYGFGPARYLWNLKSAMGIFFLGAGVTLYHGAEAVFDYFAHGAEGHTQESSMVGIGVLLLALVLEGISLVVAVVGINRDRGEMTWKEFIYEGDDPTGVGVLFEDGAAVLGVLVALAGVGLSQILHNPLPDALASLVIGLLLGWLAVFLAKTNGRLLIGRAASTNELERIRRVLESDDLIEKVEDLKTEILGQGRIRVKCEIEFYEKLIAQQMREALRDDVRRLEEGEEAAKVLVDVVGRTVRQAGNEINRLEKLIREVAPNAVHIDLELM